MRFGGAYRRGFDEGWDKGWEARDRAPEFDLLRRDRTNGDVG